MIQKKGVFLLFALLFSYVCTYAQKPDSYFFSNEDKENIRLSAQTSWGKQIIAQLKAQVGERLKHPLNVPKEEAGHLHDYFCPVHNVFFEFDWNKPHAQYCSHCKKTWSTDRIDWAWITVAQGRNLQFMTDCMYIYLATGEPKYAKYMKDMILDYADKYPNYNVHDKGRNKPEPDNYSAKMFAQSLDEAVWFSDACRVYSVVKPLLKKKEIEKVEKNLLWEAANLLMQRGGGGNWQVWNNSGLAAIGVALNNDSIVNVAINNPKVGYRHMMETHVNRDGWWNEGSANYHFFPLRAMILTADGVRSMGYNLFDKQLEMMFLAPINSAYSDLTFPSHNDGWYGVSLPTQIKLYEMAFARYRNPVMLQTLAAAYQIEDRFSPEALLTNTAVNRYEELKKAESYLFGQTGYGLLRSGNKTVVLKYGPSGGGHGHPDKLSIAIHNGEKEILPDFGTCAYGIPDYLNWYKRTLSHNTVTVDFKDQKPTTGQIVNFAPTAIEAFSDKAYPGVDMTRKLQLKDNALTDDFYCTSDSVHTYDYVLLLTDKPDIDGTFGDAVLNESIAYQQIRNVKKSTMNESVTLRTSTGKIVLRVDGTSFFELFVGEAPGVPPTNPDIVTKTGTERSPVQPCYPVIIRVKDKNLNIKGEWIFVEEDDKEAFTSVKHYDSYKGLIMTGYQGWFSCPGDGSDRGWYHYQGRDGFKPGSCTIDMWPDVTEYDRLYKTEFEFADGTPAFVMSEYDESTVETHFRWMREYGIDGAFIQRFVSEIKRPKSYRQMNKVWQSAIRAANNNNRAISAMYDLSGMVAGDEQVVLKDIDHLESMYRFKDRTENPSYLYHNGKPLVAVWGIGFNDNRSYGFREAEIIIDGLVARGYSIMIGVPTQWRLLTGDTLNDKELHRLIKKCDIVMPWFVGRYNEEGFAPYAKLVKDDIDWCKENKVDYAPLAFPGFSWINMVENSIPIDRNKGNFYWKQLSSHIANGAEMIYAAMFDEIDEGTALFKCAKVVPVGDSYFLPIDEELETDHYLWLTGKAGQMLRKEIPLSEKQPIRRETK